MGLYKNTEILLPPKPDDKDYMKVWNEYMKLHIESYDIRHQNDVWRRAFLTISVILSVFLFVLLVVICGKLFSLHSTIFS